MNQLISFFNSFSRLVVQQLKSLLSTLDGRVASLEKGGVPAKSQAPTGKAAEPAKKDDDDDIDLFGSDDEDDEEAEKGNFFLI